MPIPNSSCFCFSAPLGGFLSDKWSNRVVVMFGGMLCAAGAIGAAFATDMGIVVFTYGALIGKTFLHLKRNQVF